MHMHIRVSPYTQSSIFYDTPLRLLMSLRSFLPGAPWFWGLRVLNWEVRVLPALNNGLSGEPENLG